MYDTIGIFWENGNVSQNYLKNLRTTTYNNTGATVLYGDLENMRVKMNGNKVSIIGSLPKFYLGNNFQELKRKDVKLALEKLSDNLSLPLKEGKIFRLDVGANFLLNDPLQVYYSCFGNLPRYKKSEISNRDALLFTTQRLALEFYNKKKEMRRRHEDIPEEIIDKNVLRFETHLTGKVAKSMKLTSLTANNLFEIEFYRNAVNLWQNLYFSIPRVRLLRLKREALPIINRRKLSNQLSVIGVKYIGENELLSLIEDSKNGIKNKQQISRMRKLVRELANNPELTEPNEAIKELDKKIAEKAEEAYE